MKIIFTRIILIDILKILKISNRQLTQMIKIFLPELMVEKEKLSYLQTTEPHINIQIIYIFHNVNKISQII